jgi:hypothetical protein
VQHRKQSPQTNSIYNSKKFFILPFFLYDRQMRHSSLTLAGGMGSGYGSINLTDPAGSSGEDMVEAGLHPHPISKFKI